MATTKKVARVRSLKKKAVPKNPASSVRKKAPVQRNKTPKTKQKAVKKMTIKKALKKNISTKLPVKKVVKKRNRVKIQDKTTASTFAEKVQSKAVKNTLVKRRSLLPLTTKMPMGLMVLSAFRFPMNIDTFAMQTARVGGLAIVAMGAFFTLMFSQYIWNAPIIAGDISGTQLVGTSLLSSTTPHVADLTLVEKEPPVTFNVQDIEPLSNEVLILIDVDIADSVNVLVFEESYTSPIYLGLARQIQSDLWEFKWDTTDFKDVKYKIAVDVHNIYTIGQPYRDSDDSGYLQVDNNPTESAHAATSTFSEVSEKPQAELEITSSSPASGDVQIEISVADADKVTLYAHHKESGSNNRLGVAQSVATDLWTFVWDTTDYSDGDYLITSKILNQDGSYLDGEDVVTVANASDSPQSDNNKDSSVLIDPPEAKLKIMDSGVLSDIVELQVDIAETQFVELWVVSAGSYTEKIIALAQRSDLYSDIWIYNWNTRDIPNGDYKLFARVKNTFGVYRSNYTSIGVFNRPFDPVLTDIQKEEAQNIETAQVIAKEILTKPEKAVDSTDNTLTKESSSADEAKQILSKFSEDIDDELKRLTTAYRSEDQVTIQRAEKRIAALKQDILDSVVSDEHNDVLLKNMDQQIDKIIAEHKVMAVKIETIIRERVGDTVFKDSDSDGISDYDERALYNTDPYSADSDGDGFNDGVEVAQGYDPLDSKREVAVVFESPKEKGVTREDILVVDSIIALIPENSENDRDGVEAQAVISGKALPNSFVTLYIYSTPIIITVKTEADGSWQYRFDKELEDGEHKIYVGVTDNAGRIVAKSAAFTFVKEAQAFSPVDASVTGTISNQKSNDSLLSTYMIYLILSVSVVSIGLVLILLGLHLDTRQRRFKGVVNTGEES